MDHKYIAQLIKMLRNEVRNANNPQPADTDQMFVEWFEKFPSLDNSSKQELLHIMAFLMNSFQEEA